jgi:hypothetical protein
MTGLDDLEKALDRFQSEYNNYLDLTEKVLPGQPKPVREFVESMLESLTLYNLSIDRMKADLEVFKTEYDGQVHVSRKQLEDNVTCRFLLDGDSICPQKTYVCMNDKNDLIKPCDEAQIFYLGRIFREDTRLLRKASKEPEKK